MSQRSVSAKVPEKKDAKGIVTQKALGPAELFVECPDTAKEQIEKYGDEPVASNSWANWKVVLQSGIRAALKAGLNAEQIQEKFSKALMGIATIGGAIDAQAAYIAKFKSSNPQEQAEMIKMLKSQAAEK